MSNTTNNVTRPSNFSDLGLISPLLTRLTELKYLQPSPIQAKAIPSILAGRDLIAGANTGSGKTATFALPILQKIQLQKLQQKGQLNPQHSEKPSNNKSNKGGKGNYVTSLILVPTRELSKQVADSFKSYAAHLNGAIKTISVFGGVSANTQMLALRGGADILVAGSFVFKAPDPIAAIASLKSISI